MRASTALGILLATILISSCDVSVNSPANEEHPHESTNTKPVETTPPERFTFKTMKLFPFKNPTNWWAYSEPGGNTLHIAVTDTISDDSVTFYRVSFMEHRVDTTDDWFQQSAEGVLFGASLTGTYVPFLPPSLASKQGTFVSRSKTVSWTYTETANINGTTVSDAVTLTCTTPIIHGFDEIVLADSIGIVELIDQDGRWTIDYTLDSCSIDGKVQVF